MFRFVPPEGMRLTELAGLAEITKQTCGEIIDDFEELGCVVLLEEIAAGERAVAV